MLEFDPRDLDRDLARAAAAERRWRRQMRRDPAAADDAWFRPVRWVTTRTTFAAVLAMPVYDPLREPRLRWIFRLALARIAQPALLEVYRARDRIVQMDEPQVIALAAGELVRKALAERDAARRALWLRGLEQVSGEVRSAERRAGEATAEIARQIGVETPESLTSPYDAGVLRDACRSLLARTDDLAKERLGAAKDTSTLLGQLTCREVAGSWPSLASSRWLFELFAGTPLLEGTSSLDLGPLPMLLGAATFARALARFGAAWSRAAAAQAGPPIAAQDATEAAPLRHGALFASLIADPTFLRRKLGFSRDTAHAVGRALADAALAHARLAAARTLHDLRAMAAIDARDVLEDALKVRIDHGLVGLLPKFGEGAPVRAASVLLSTSDAARLRDAYDEDWFANPRGLRALREAAARPPSLTVPKGELENGARDFAAWIESLASG